MVQFPGGTRRIKFILKYQYSESRFQIRDTLIFDQYHTVDVMYAWLHRWAEKYPKLLDVCKKGVIDKFHLVFGYENMFVVDSSTIPANLGMNPSLTITAIAERAMSYVPKKE